jgi:hypothetical protein
MPEKLAKIRYFETFHKKMNIHNPQNLNEKINWLKFNSDTSLWSELSDKYCVRDYVRKIGLADLLNELYAVWYSPKEIDFNILPKSFVLKINNGSGGIYLVSNKDNISEDKIRKAYYKRFKSTPYGIYSAEPHYRKIKPCIVAERLLKDTIQENALIDYKFYCIFGEPHSVLVCTNRKEDKKADKMIYDMEWIAHPEFMSNISMPNELINKPITFDKMIESCKLLGKPFAFVRIDFYEVDGKCYFGELTFTPSGGYINSQNKLFLKKMGEKIKLPS